MYHDRALALLVLAVVLADCASAPIRGAGERIGRDPHPGTPVATQHAPETAILPAEPRPSPWNDSALVVVATPAGDREFDVFRGSDVDAGTEHRQAEAALDCYERGPSGMLASLTVHVTGHRSAADVVVRRGDCGAAAPSCFTAQGPDLDGDGAIEQYHRAAIVLNGVPDDAVGWHVGNWLAYLLGAERVEQRPPPFRNADAGERRSEWWDDD
jgi:hypothetical protein